MYIVNWIQTS